MARAISCLSLFLILTLSGVETLWGQTRTVSVEIVVGDLERLGVEQDIMSALEKSGADNVRVSRGGGSVAIGVEESQAGNGSLIRVKGAFESRTYLFPGAKFQMNDIAGMTAYFKKLKDDGATVALADKQAFGLTNDQLVALYAVLAAEVAESTTELSLQDFVNQAEEALPLPFVVSPVVRGKIAESGKLFDELKGVSMGTALALALRPYGLVMSPRRLQGQKIELIIAESGEADEFWPVGWPNEDLRYQAALKCWSGLMLKFVTFDYPTR
ncbi:MAG: hypothetical protein R3C03_04945 [Pirellulaceae bacterium]